MIDRVPARGRFAVVAALGLGLAIAAQAQDNTPAKEAAPASRDAIADAKKDFDKIKSARDDALLPGSQLPRGSVPDPTLPVAPSLILTPKNKTPPRETKSANWLVDAMEKQGSSRDAKGLDARTRDRNSRGGTRSGNELGEEDETRLAAESDEGRGLREQKAQREAESKPVVVNPLTAFLGEWMTPQDYALLKPGFTAGTETGPASKNLVAPITNGTAVPTSGVADISFGGPITPTAAFPQPPRENPYLQSLKPDLPVAPEVKPMIPPPISVTVRAPVTAVPPPPPVTPKISDFARPSEDDRYFKQLKRF